MRLSIRQAILGILAEGHPMSGEALLGAVRALRFKLTPLDLLFTGLRFPKALRQLLHEGRIQYIRFEGRDRKHNFKYVLTTDGSKRKRPKSRN